MKRILVLYRSFLILILVSGLGSCEKFFDPENETLLNEEENFTDYLSSRSSVNGLYALMQDIMDAYIINGELKADMITVTPNASQDLVDFNNRVFEMDNPFVDIRPVYRIISNANDVILHLEGLMQKESSYEDELLNMYAEAVILRSWVYFYLYRNYSGTPYIEKDVTSMEGDLDIDKWLSENGGMEIELSKLISEVERVKSYLLPDGYTENDFFNIASANAFLGEMYLWDNNYNAAIDALLFAAHSADNFRFILDLDQEKAKWANIFKGDESAADEIMTKIIFDKGEKQENQLLDLFSSISQQGMQLQPVEYYVNQFESTYRIAGTFNIGSEVAKYTRSMDDPFTSDMPVLLYRAADVHLMLAEAYNRVGNVSLSLDIVNNGSDTLFTAFSKGVRGRVGLPATTVNGDNLQDSIVDLENKIIAERARELAYEGKRWYDLVRIANRRNDPELLVNWMLNKYPENDEGRIRDFYNDPANWRVKFK
jgi:hypothetical protein